MQSTYTKSPKTFSKFFVFLLIFLLFVCCLTLLTTFFYKLSVTTTEKSHFGQIEEVRLATDNKINNELHNYLHSNLSRPITSVNTFSTFLKSTDTDSAFFQKIRIDLFDHYLLKQDILNDILLFRYSDNAFVSATRAGYNLESTYSHTSVNYIDLHELVALGPLGAPMFYNTTNSHLYYVFPVYRQATESSAEYLGFAGLYINPDTFFGTSISFPDGNHGTSLVLKDKEIIFVNGENVLSEKAIISVVNHFSETQNIDPTKYSYTTNFASSEYVFYYTHSDTYGLTFLYYELILSPSEIFFNLQNDLTKLYWFSIIIICLLFIFIATQRIFISRKKIFSPKNEPASYEYIDAKENFIFKNTVDLLCGNISSQHLDHILCRILDINKTDKYTSCILIAPEPLTILKMTADQRNTFLAEITESVRMNLEISIETHFAVINYPQNKLTCLINSNNFLPETLAHNILQHLESVYNCHFNVFCSTPVLVLSDLQRNYSAIVNGQKYAYIYNYNNLFTQDSIERFEATDEIIDSGLGPKMRQYFREHDFDGLAQYIEAIPDTIRRNGYSHSRVYDHYRTVFFNITTFCTSNYTNFPYRDIPAPDLMKQFETIDEATTFLSDFIISLNNTAIPTEKEQGDNISKKFIDRIIEYIDEHIVDVSLNGVAAHFNVSAAHLSRVFKESFGINFSEYVAEKKLQKAVKLLLDENNYNIGEIAKILGYNTPAYFSRKFKERFDLTPAMYRKQYMTDTK